MLVSLIEAERLYTLSLPNKVSGRYWLEDRDDQGHWRRIANVEGVQNQWRLRGEGPLTLSKADGREDGSITLETGIQVIGAQWRSTGEPVQFYVEPTTDDRQHFRKFCVRDGCRIDIGRAENNQIIYNNGFVSSRHACLIWKGGNWSVTDTQSRNGTFVNGVRVAMRELAPGDAVWIMGLKVVVGKGFFAVNDPDGRARVSMEHLTNLQPQQIVRREELEPPQEKPFSPAPALHRVIETEEVQVDPPPNAQKPDETPLPLLLGPALTMGMTAVVMASVALNNYMSGMATLAGTIPSLIMSLSMLCGTMLWPLLTKRHEKKKLRRLEQRRQERYEAYLDGVRGDIFAIAAKQKEILLENYPGSEACAARAVEQSRALWERTYGQTDFLALRLGLGQVPIKAEFKFPEERFAVEEDLLQNAVQRLAREPKVIQGAPVVCSLREHRVLGIVGKPEETECFLKSLLLQMATLHSYDELKLVFLNGDAAMDKWGALRLWPHAWDNERQVHYWACSGEERKAISAILEKVLLERGEGKPGEPNIGCPHYVLVATSLEYAKQVPAFRQALTAPEECGISCIIQADNIVSLPKECSVVIGLDGDKGALFDRDDPSHLRTEFKPEDMTQVDLDRVTRSLANVALDRRSERYVLPKMLTFLEMYGVGKVEHLNALTRWRDNNPVNTLQAPIGVGQDGAAFYLDLHEKYHGPHGLVAGMTGSGKSEFIITFILSMAVNYHPDEVSFILIDYKGGGLAGAFEDRLTGVRLPHLAGTITNLDGAAVSRALISIQSELRRRQAIFNEARQISGEGTIDIYKYQKMYRNGVIKTPVPHLFIISDEFAELKAQQPEFMAQLISTARIGRSLGVHLILATQKPSGVVDDQIWSNSRFRVCLKVQEKADSMEMLKRPDAAELSDTGRFYLQVGFNELFDLGQSAWCGAPYIPADYVEKKQDDGVEVLDGLGRVLSEAKEKASKGNSDGKSQIVSIVSYLSKLAQEEHVEARQLWLPPIPEKVYLDDLARAYGWQCNELTLDPIVGEYDNPFNQSKGLVTLPFTEGGNALVYGATGSGKSILLDTLLCGMLRSYDADHLNVYIIDMGEETLRAFSGAPQVGGVLLASDQEKICNLFKLLEEEMESRKKRFADWNGDYRTYCQGTGEVVPHILVLLRNYAAFYEQFEDLDGQLGQLSRDCFKYGIYFLITANSANAVRYRISQNFPNLLALQLNDRSDYVGLFGRTEGVYPSAIKGRGIFKTDRVYEFQSARFAEDDSLRAVRTLTERLRETSSARARPVPHLPERVTADSFPGELSRRAVPVGVEKASLRNACLDMERTSFTLVSGQNLEDVAAVAQGFAQQMSRLEGGVTVLDGAGSFPAETAGAYPCVRGSFSEVVETVFQEMVYRNNTYKAAQKNGETLPVYAPVCYLVTGLAAILKGLDEDKKDKLTALLGRVEPAYGIHFVLCDGAEEFRELSGAKWYTQRAASADGVWVGDGVTDQNVFRLARISNALYAELPPQFGYVVRKGKPALSKLLVEARPEEVEENG